MRVWGIFLSPFWPSAQFRECASANRDYVLELANLRKQQLRARGGSSMEAAAFQTGLLSTREYIARSLILYCMYYGKLICYMWHRYKRLASGSIRIRPVPINSNSEISTSCGFLINCGVEIRFQTDLDLGSNSENSSNYTKSRAWPQIYNRRKRYLRCEKCRVRYQDSFEAGTGG